MSFCKKPKNQEKIIIEVEEQERGFPNQSPLRGNLGVSSTQQETFYLSLGSGETSYNTQDPTLLWSYNVPTLIPGQKKRILEIQFLGAFLKNFSSHEFPDRLGLKIDDLAGFTQLVSLTSPQTGEQHWINANRGIVAWAATTQLTELKSSSEIPTYNVVYQNMQDLVWDLGSLNTLNLRVVDSQGNALPGPFNNPVSLHMKIHHIAL